MLISSLDLIILATAISRQQVKPDKGKASAFPSELVLRDEHVPNLAILLKQVLNVVGTCPVRQVVHLQRHHVRGVWWGAPRIPRHPEDSRGDITLK